MTEKAAHIYEKIAGVRDWAVKNIPTHIRKGIAGSVAGAAAGVILAPIDTISDVQKQWRNTRNDKELNNVGKHFLATAKEIYHPKVRKDAEGGIRPFYSGMGGKLSKTIPLFGILNTVTKPVERYLKVAK